MNTTALCYLEIIFFPRSIFLANLTFLNGLGIDKAVITDNAYVVNIFLNSNDPI